MEPEFSMREYHTPENARRYLGDKLVLNSRLYFSIRYVGIIGHSRYLVARNQLDAERVFLRIFRLLEGCGGQFHITGLEHIRNCQEPVVIISNHMSNVESNTFGCMLLPCMDMTYVVKASLLKFPIFGPVLSSINPISVSRTDPREDLRLVFKEGLSRLKKGISIVVFPQSTRCVDFVPGEFNTLGVKLAHKAAVPIMPVAVKTDFWGIGRYFWRDFGPLNRDKPIHFAFGEPIDVMGNPRKAHQRVIEFIQCHLEQWNEDSTKDL
jgi:1-acyl-sn-glycerol-3-phosphate acyltransferase